MTILMPASCARARVATLVALMVFWLVSRVPSRSMAIKPISWASSWPDSLLSSICSAAICWNSLRAGAAAWRLVSAFSATCWHQVLSHWVARKSSTSISFSLRTMSRPSPKGRRQARWSWSVKTAWKSSLSLRWILRTRLGRVSKASMMVPACRTSSISKTPPILSRRIQ